MADIGTTKRDSTEDEFEIEINANSIDKIIEQAGRISSESVRSNTLLTLCELSIKKRAVDVRFAAEDTKRIRAHRDLVREQTAKTIADGAVERHKQNIEYNQWVIERVHEYDKERQNAIQAEITRRDGLRQEVNKSRFNTYIKVALLFIALAILIPALKTLQIIETDNIYFIAFLLAGVTALGLSVPRQGADKITEILDGLRSSILQIWSFDPFIRNDQNTHPEERKAKQEADELNKEKPVDK